MSFNEVIAAIMAKKPLPPEFGFCIAASIGFTANAKADAVVTVLTNLGYSVRTSRNDINSLINVWCKKEAFDPKPEKPRPQRLMQAE